MPGLIDLHAHIGHTVSSDTGQGVDDYLKVMERAGIERAVISVAAGGLASNGIADTMKANDVIAEGVRKYPERLPLGLASIEVRHGARGVEEVSRVMEELGLAGLAFHPAFEGFSVDSVAFRNVLDAIGDREALILLHAHDGFAPPSAIARTAQAYPSITFIMGHPVLSQEQRDESVAAVKSADNVYIDLAYQDESAITEEMVNRAGSSKIVYGSDAPFFDALSIRRSIEAAGISEADKSRILYENAEVILERFAR
jgi:predicted TIM-barrel fold metal-dependent hydrolase